LWSEGLLVVGGIPEAHGIRRDVQAGSVVVVLHAGMERIRERVLQGGGEAGLAGSTRWGRRRHRQRRRSGRTELMLEPLHFLLEVDQVVATTRLFDLRAIGAFEAGGALVARRLPLSRAGHQPMDVPDAVALGTAQFASAFHFSSPALVALDGQVSIGRHD
jgi:hypothetical protein